MEQKNKICIKARLVAQKMDGAYKIYVFQDTIKLNYVMCTRVPNWQCDAINVGEDGFLDYHTVIGGVDRYFDSVDGVYKHYMQDATYFLNFVPITKVLADGYVVDNTKLVTK